MNLLTATTRYYLLLTTGLFAVASALLYTGLPQALRHETDEQLLNGRLALEQRVASGRLLPNDLLFAYELARSPQPRRLGYSDTLLLDERENELVPFRQLTFRLDAGRGPEWLTLRQSLVERRALGRVLLKVLLGALGLLLLGIVVLNRWVARRLWQPFEHTLARLRTYDLQQHRPLELPRPPITQFAELNHALNQLSERLVADYESLRQFTENASHEIRTPLAIIQAQLEQLLQSPALATDEAMLTLVGDLLQNTQRLSRLHQSLTLLSRLENQLFASAEAVPMYLEQVMRNRLELLEPLLEVRDLRLALHLAPNLPPHRLHPGLTDSLVQNLLQNAVKHNVPSGEIVVTLTATALEISNTGPAIEGDPARFFERFHKHNAASDSPGLGLSIVQHICAYYGWQVRYEFAAGLNYHTLRVQFGKS